MNKTTTTWIDVCILIIMLAVSAVITMTSVSMIVGDTANIAQDKVLFDAGSLEYSDTPLTVEMMMLATTRVDLVYPVDQYKIKYKDKEITVPCGNDAVVNRSYIASRISGMREDTVSIENFFTYPVDMHMSFEDVTGKYTCNVTIKEVP